MVYIIFHEILVFFLTDQVHGTSAAHCKNVISRESHKRYGMGCSLQRNSNVKNHASRTFLCRSLQNSGHISCKFAARKLHDDYTNNCPPPTEFYTVLARDFGISFSTKDLLITSTFELLLPPSMLLPRILHSHFETRTSRQHFGFTQDTILRNRRWQNSENGGNALNRVKYSGANSAAFNTFHWGHLIVCCLCWPCW